MSDLLTTLCHQDNKVVTLLGENRVLRDLLSQTLTVLETIDPDGDSAEGLETLMYHIEAALKAPPCP